MLTISTLKCYSTNSKPRLSWKYVLNATKSKFQESSAHSSAGAAALCEVVRGLTFFHAMAGTAQREGLGGGALAPPLFRKNKNKLNKK